MEQESGSVDIPSGSAGAGTKLFLGGLSWDTNEAKIQEHFSKYGEVTEVIVMRDRITNKPRGFGFITFKDDAAALAACQEVHTLDGRTIDAKPSVPQGEGQRPRSKKIFVGGLAPDTTEDQFKEYFEQYGTISEAQIMVDHQSGRSRGFGFITFEEEESVEKVFSAGNMHELNGKKVEVKNATPKGSGPQGGRGGGRGYVQGRGGYSGGRGGYGDYSQMQGGYGGYGMPGYGMYGQYGYQVPYGTFMYGGYGGYGGYSGGGYGQSYPSGGQGGGQSRRQQQQQQQQ